MEMLCGKIRAADVWQIWKGRIMSLIKCPECGKEISTTAKTCPNCGYVLPKEREHRLICSLNGQGGQVYLYTDMVAIERKGSLGKSAYGFFQGRKEIFLETITAVQMKMGETITNGYIQFSVMGEDSHRNNAGVWASPTHDENTVFFTKKRNEDAKRLRDEFYKLKGIKVTRESKPERAMPENNKIKYANGRKKRKWPFVILGIFVFFIIIIISVASGSNNSSGSNDHNITEDTPSEISPADYNDTVSYLSAYTQDIEVNTSSMVDAIANAARASANYSSSEEKREEALSYIADHYPNYFIDNNTMELTMYYGYYLEYAYARNGSDNVYANLGMDTYQAVKDVYRNTETTEDEHVLANLEQIKELLQEVGYSIQ